MRREGDVGVGVVRRRMANDLRMVACDIVGPSSTGPEWIIIIIVITIINIIAITIIIIIIISYGCLQHRRPLIYRA